MCLTVVAWDAETFTSDVMRQTLDVTAIGEKGPGTRVNVERAMAANGRLGGHIVQGHVDGTSTILEVRPGDEWQVIRCSLDREHAPLVVAKGSIALEGVSLTVSAAGRDWFEVSLIPETLGATTLGDLAPGDRVSIETDVLARHVARLAEFGALPGVQSPDPSPKEA